MRIPSKITFFRRPKATPREPEDTARSTSARHATPVPEGEVAGVRPPQEACQQVAAASAAAPAEPPHEMNPSVWNRVVFFGLSDVGLKRTNNEDHFIVADLTRKVLGVKDNCVVPGMICHQVGPAGTLLAVADGLGGYDDGEIASRLAVEVLVQTFLSLPEVDFSPAEQLARAVQEAHEAIRRHASEATHGTRMGSTLTAVHVGQERLTLAQVGDSRAYRFSHGTLEQLTEDQTVVNIMLKKGVLTPEAARCHPNRHIILQALGQNGKVTPEVWSLPFQPGDCLLLCSDGLSSFVPHEALEAILQVEKDENRRCRRFIEAAYAGGGADNVTVLLARLLEQEAE